jgi:hypothetical protein
VSSIYTDKNAFELFCELHPHEAHRQDRERFLAYARGKCPHLTDVQIERLLEQTEEA